MKFLKSTYRLIALVMACLMFFTSVGFSMNLHYCGGALKSVGFFGKAKTCHDMVSEKDAVMKNCPHHKKMLADKMDCSEDRDCCSNKTVLFQSDQDQQVQNSEFVLGKQLQQFVAAYVAVFFSNDFSLDREGVAFALYIPPLIARDIPVLHQTFLI